MNYILTFVRFTMLTVLLIIQFTMGLRYVNFRDRYYYSALLNTFNICADATNTGQNNSENMCTNNNLQESNFNATRTPSASFSSDNRGVNSQRIHELQEVSAFYWRSLAVGYAAADEEKSEPDITLLITTLAKLWRASVNK